ncbi:hypothetical protein C8R47DRAFT_1085076 [Mycena vitilis]|nr:hypothetical protein C8R47DRAFT_1085076 [Mycena vitilis]
MGLPPPIAPDKIIPDASLIPDAPPVPDTSPMASYDPTEDDPGAVPAYETATNLEKASRTRQAELLCRQCWINKHRTMPTHWAFIWSKKDRFFEKHDFCRVMKSTAIGLGHYGERCTEAGARAALKAGIFPGSVKDPKTGYTLGLLDYYRQGRSQGTGSAYDFVHVLRRTADPIFAGSVPDIYINFLPRHLPVLRIPGDGYAKRACTRRDVPLLDEADRPYPHRPEGFLGAICAACPERGVICLCLSSRQPIFANLFIKRDDGSDIALTDGRMHFPAQTEYAQITKDHVVAKKYTVTHIIPSTEVPCKAHIGSIRHQGSVKYGNEWGCCQLLCGHAQGRGICAENVCLARAPEAHQPAAAPSESTTPTVYSYDSWCSFVINLVRRAIALFPEEEWLHELLASAEGQIPADHCNINGHGPDCQACWQAVYFACRAHYHGETAEVIWTFLNPLGASTRQMTGAARHDILNFVIDAWNRRKIVRQAELSAAERLDALQLFELHMAVVEDLSRQHAAEVAEWSRMSRVTTKSADGKIRSVYQHETTKGPAEDVGKKPGKKAVEKQRKSKKPDGWIWLESMVRGQNLGEGQLAKYKKESDKVQWHRAEAEMYRWLEAYERKHAEGFRVREKFRRESEVWTKSADREEARSGGVNGSSTFCRMQATTYDRLRHNADVIFKSATLGAHHDWVSATSFDELLVKMDKWRDVGVQMDGWHAYVLGTEALRGT